MRPAGLGADPWLVLPGNCPYYFAKQSKGYERRLSTTSIKKKHSIQPLQLKRDVQFNHFFVIEFGGWTTIFQPQHQFFSRNHQILGIS